MFFNRNFKKYIFISALLFYGLWYKNTFILEIEVWQLVTQKSVLGPFDIQKIVLFCSVYRGIKIWVSPQYFGIKSSLILMFVIPGLFTLSKRWFQVPRCQFVSNDICLSVVGFDEALFSKFFPNKFRWDWNGLKIGNSS